MNNPIHLWDLMLGMLLGAAMMAGVWITQTRPIQAPTTDVACLEVVRVHPRVGGGYILTVQWPTEVPLPEMEP